MSNPDPQTAACDYCGLPLAESWWKRRAEHKQGQQYCCLGCRFAANVAQERGPQGEANWTLARLGLCIFLAINVMMFTMVLWTDDVYVGDAPNAASALAGPLADVLRYLCLLASLPVLYLLGGPLAAGAWQGLREGRPSTDLLLLLGVIAAYVYSTVSVLRGEGHVYFEVGCLVLVLVTLGRWLEATGKLRTTSALDALEKLLPEKVRRVVDGRESLVPLHDIGVGDVLRVAAGERIPTDGVIERGTAHLDEQLLTGESSALVKEPGDAVFGGTLDVDSDLLVRVTAAPQQGTLQRLIDAVTQARREKGRYQRLADRLAAWFTPLVMAVAIAAAVAHGARSGFEHGLLTGLAVVLIACPCALGLATPLAVWTALGEAARSQVLFVSGEALERLAGARAICFDKTGTLTTGEARLAEVIAADPQTGDEARRRAAALAGRSSHPLARSLAAAVSQDIERSVLVNTHPGRGLSAEIDGDAVVLGSPRWMEELHLGTSEDLHASIERLHAEGRSLTCIGWNGRVKGVFAFDEQVRPEAREALAACRAAGLHATVLTGDLPARAAALGEDLGVQVEPKLLPDDKVAAIARIRAAWGPTVMVGDGINDAPALAAADVGMALGCGADVSRESADVCLLGNDLRRIAWSIELARRTVRVIRQNLFWALAYNVLGVGLAAAGWLNPIWAAVAMTASSAFVITNSLRLNSRAGVINAGMTTINAHSLTKSPEDFSDAASLRADARSAPVLIPCAK